MGVPGRLRRRRPGTEIAVRAAFKAIQDEQVAVLVRTTRHLEPHQQTFAERCATRVPRRRAVALVVQSDKEAKDVLA